MRCEELRERFLDPPSQELSRHLEGCPDCRQDWLLFQQMQAMKAPVLAASFDRAVLDGLQRRGFFDPPPLSVWRRFSGWLSRALPPVAALACLLLLFWLGNLANTRPGPQVRSLAPDTARLWSSLPDAVPPPIESGPAPAGGGLRVGKERDEKDT